MAAFLCGVLTALAVLVAVVVGTYLLTGHEWLLKRPAGPLASHALITEPTVPPPSPAQVERPAESPAPAKTPAAGSGTPSEPGKTNAAASQPGGFSTKEIVARCERSAARVSGPAGHGSGFLVKPNVLVTNAHVVRNDSLNELRVHFPSADEPDRGPFNVEGLLAEDQTGNLAFLVVRCTLPPLKAAEKHTFVRGEDVVLIGSPGPIETAVSRGVLSSTHEIRGQSVYQLGAPLNRGNSGGPVFNDAAEVIGVAVAHVAGMESLGFCIPAADLRSGLDALPAEGSEAAQRTASLHRAAVAFRRLDTLCSWCETGVRAYVVFGKAAEEKKIPLDQAFEAARRQARVGDIPVKEKIDGLSEQLLPGLDDIVSSIHTDSRIEPKVKESMVELWATCSEAKDYWAHPRGTLENLSVKQIELRDKHKRLAESLKILLDVRLD